MLVWSLGGRIRPESHPKLLVWGVKLRMSTMALDNSGTGCQRGSYRDPEDAVCSEQTPESGDFCCDWALFTQIRTLLPKESMNNSE